MTVLDVIPDVASVLWPCAFCLGYLCDHYMNRRHP